MFKNIDWFDFVVGGIIIGFIVNVAANFAQPKIELWWGKYNSLRREKNEALKRAFDDKVEYLINNKHEELIARTEVNRLATFGIYMTLWGMIPMILAIMLQLSSEITIIVGVLPGTAGLYRANATFRKRDKLVLILDAVDKKLGRHFR